MERRFDGPRELVSFDYPEIGTNTLYEDVELAKFKEKKGWPGSSKFSEQEEDISKWFLPKATPLGCHTLKLTQLNIEKFPVPGVDFDSFYKLNSLGFRSDEFTKKHRPGQHVLFAGCSMTFGDGIPLQYLWARKLYLKLNEIGVASGFYNVASNGASISQMLDNTTKYIKEYGKPEYIFMLIPDLNRTFNESDNSSFTSTYFRQAISFYELFADYCVQTGINLIAMSWEPSVNIKMTKKAKPYYFISNGDNIGRGNTPEFRDRVSQFYKIDYAEMQDFILKTTMDNRDTHEAGLFLDLAWDDAHPGIAEHQFWYNKFYEKYLDISKEVGTLANL